MTKDDLAWVDYFWGTVFGLVVGILAGSITAALFGGGVGLAVGVVAAVAMFLFFNRGEPKEIPLPGYTPKDEDFPAEAFVDCTNPECPENGNCGGQCAENF